MSRKTDNLVDSYKSDVEFLSQEIEAVTGMLARLAVEESALDGIRSRQLQQLESMLKVDTYKSEFLSQEIEAVTGMLARLAVEESALDGIRSRQLQQLESMLKVDSELIHTNLKKKESLFYRKYLKANTSEELTTLLNSIRQRQTALKHLELLAYRKVLNLRSVAVKCKKPRLMPKPTKFSKIADVTTDFQVRGKKESEIPAFFPLPWTWDSARTNATVKWKWENDQQEYCHGKL